MGVDTKEVAALLGLSEDEFQRYVGIGLIKIKAPRDPEFDEAPAAWEIQMGNKVVEACFHGGRLTRHEIRFARGKKSVLMERADDEHR